MIRAFRLLQLRGLLRLRTAVAMVAVAAGSSLAMSVIVVRSSVNASVAAVGRALGAEAPLRVEGAVVSGGLPASILTSVQAAPGVGLAVPVIQVATVSRLRTGADTAVAVFGLP